MDLPDELISHIGKFLVAQDRRVCIETSKVLRCISNTYIYHIMNFTEDNIVSKVHNLPQTLRYIKSIKPRLQVVEMVFDNINTATVSLPNNVSIAFEQEDIATTVYFKECKYENVKDIVESIIAMQRQNKKVSVHMKLTESHLTDVEQWFFRADEMTTSYVQVSVGNDSVHRILSNAFIKRAKSLYIASFVYLEPLDLSYVDTTINQDLGVSMHVDVRVIDVQKITELMFQIKGRSVRPDQNLLHSFKTCPMDKLRLRKIFVFEDPFTCNFIEIAKMLPKSVEYFIMINSPWTVWLVSQLIKIGVSSVSYLVKDRESYITALFCTRVFPNIRVCMKDMRNTTAEEDSDSYSRMSIVDLYDAMSPSQQQEWFSTLMATKLMATRNK